MLQATNVCRLRDVAASQWRKDIDAPLGVIPFSLRVIKDQLWACCFEAGIVVFDHTLTQQHVIRFDKSIGSVYDAAEMNGGDVIIATDRAIYQTGDESRTLLPWASAEIFPGDGEQFFL